jgi:hypothetical protein
MTSFTIDRVPCLLKQQSDADVGNFCLVQYKETWQLWCHSVFAVRDVTFIPLLLGEGHTGNRLVLPPVQYTFLPEIWCNLLTWLSHLSLSSPLFQWNPIWISARRMFVVFFGPSMWIPRYTCILQLLPRSPFFPLSSHHSVILFSSKYRCLSIRVFCLHFGEKIR